MEITRKDIRESIQKAVAAYKDGEEYTNILTAEDYIESGIWTLLLEKWEWVK